MTHMPTQVSIQPKRWPLVRLGQVCSLVGKNLDPRMHPDEKLAHYSIPAFDAGQQPAYELGSSIGSNKTEFPSGAVLFSKLNPRIARVWEVTDEHILRRVCSTEFLPLMPEGEHLHRRYLALVLQEPSLISHLRSRVAAATKSRERLKPLHVLEAMIPLPPLSEQKRIVAVLEEQMAAVEKARVAAEARLEAAGALPAALLRHVFPDIDEPLPDGWSTRALGECSEVAAGVTLGRKLDHRETRNVPYLRVANVKDGWLSLDDLAETPATEDEIRSLRLEHGDLLLTEGGDADKLGRGSVWDGQIVECIHQNHIFRVRLAHEVVLPKFASMLIGSGYGKRYFLRHAKQTTGIATINQRVLKAFPLAFPSIGDQEDIVERIASQLSTSDGALRTSIDVVASIRALRTALLRRAFTGGSDNHV